MDRLTYMIIAYAIVWVLIFAYVFIVGNRVSALEKELEALKVALKRTED